MIWCLYCGRPFEEFVSSFEKEGTCASFEKLPDGTPVVADNSIFAPMCPMCFRENPLVKVCVREIEEELPA